MRDHNAGVPEELLVLLHVIMYETRRQAIGQPEKDWPQRLRHDILEMIRKSETASDSTNPGTEKQIS